MEQEQDGAAGIVSRGQNQLHVLPEDWSAAQAVVEPLLDRAEPVAAGTQLVVVTSDAEAAASIAARIAPAAAERGLRILAATEARRAARVQRASPAHVVTGSATTLVEMLQSTVLKLDGLRVVVLAWVDDVAKDSTAALETLMSEVPKDAARVVVANAVTPEVEQLVERYARRARRVPPAPADAPSLPPVALSYLTTSEGGRVSALRRVLDALDPESAFVVTRTAESSAAVDTALSSLGYAGSGAIRAGGTPESDSQLVVLFDLPASPEELRRAFAEGQATRVVALVTPRQVTALRRLAGGAVSPLALPEAAARARSREDSLRDELRTMLASNQFSRELLTLEPLLNDYDGAEVAAAALRVLEAERAKPQAPAAAAAGQPAMTRVYLNVGEMDNVRPGDLVGAITNEAGISRSDLGRVDVRDRHSTVDVATAVANSVVSKMTGVTIRGRRVLARVDEERDRRGPRRDDVRLGRGGREGRRERNGGGRDRGPRSRERPRRDDV